MQEDILKDDTQLPRSHRGKERNAINFFVCLTLCPRVLILGFVDPSKDMNIPWENLSFMWNLQKTLLRRLYLSSTEKQNQ